MEIEDGDEVIITPEMIEAGLLAYAKLDHRVQLAEELVIMIFREMLSTYMAQTSCRSY